MRIPQVCEYTREECVHFSLQEVITEEVTTRNVIVPIMLMVN